MRTQFKVVSAFLLLHCVASNEMSFFKSSNFAHAHARHHHQYKNNNILSSVAGRKLSPPSPPPTGSSSPIQYLETPNFDIMLLSEEPSNPTWRKYSELFPPKDMTTAPLIEVNYGNQENFPYPFIDLDRSDIESVLASLGNKKHIFVLHPRNCKPHSDSLDEFENEFLPELLQKLHKPTSTVTATNGALYNMDPVVDRILALLDSDEQKMLNDLRKTFEKPNYPNNNNNIVNSSMRNRSPSSGSIVGGRQNGVISNSRIVKNQQPKSQLRDMLYKVPCNEGYVFLIESQKNPMNPNALSDLLLRVMKVVTKMS